MTKWLVITVMACTLTVCENPSYAKSFSSGKSGYSSKKSSYTSKTSAVKKKPSRSYSFSSSKPFYIMLPQANGANEVECAKQSGGVYKCREE